MNFLHSKFRQFVATLALGALGTLTLMALPLAKAQADANVYQSTLKSTAWVLAKTSEGTSSGTGVLVDAEKKLVLSNAHVVGDARNTVVFFPKITKDRPVFERDHYLKNVKELGIRGRVVHIDRKRDLALIQLDKLTAGVEAIEFAEQSVLPGEAVQSIGNTGSTEALWVYSSGKVRAVYQKQFRTGAGSHDFRVVETDAPINSGDSGGPVVNQAGKLVAISQAIATKARMVSYSVDISEVKDFLDSPWKPAPLPIKKILEDAELDFEAHDAKGQFKVEFSDKGEKADADATDSTTVFVSSDIEYHGRAEVRRIWSLAHVSTQALSLDDMTKLLERNAQTKMGAWTMEKNAEGETLVVYCVKIDATASHTAVKSTMEYVAKLSAAMKQEFSPSQDKEDPQAVLSSWLMN